MTKRIGMSRWCDKCGKATTFKLAKGKTAPFAKSDWTDDAGHSAT